MEQLYTLGKELYYFVKKKTFKRKSFFILKLMDSYCLYLYN
jgi:hypothetical protein